MNIEAGANLKTEMDTKLLRAAVSYSFLKNDRVELGAGIGLHYLDWQVKLTGNGTLNGEPVLSASRKASVDGWAANLAFFAGYAFNERWMVNGRVDWISAKIGDIDGRLWRLGADLQYQPFRNLGFGVGYDYVDANVDYESGGEKSSVDGDMYGSTLFLNLTFL